MHLQLCLGSWGRRKWFIAMHEAATVHTVDIHDVYFQNNGRAHEVPAVAAKSAEQVSDIYIRHYRSWLRHTCKLALSPSMLSLYLPTKLSDATVNDVQIYVTFAACNKFSLYYNGKLFLDSYKCCSDHQWWALQGAFVTVSRGGTFSFVLESCSERKHFLGCFGSKVCTGFNDGDGWICSRKQPPDGWMLPGFQAQAEPLTDWQPRPRCNISDENSIWSSFNDDARDHQCLGLSPFPDAIDIVSCAVACCNDNSCSRFQWCNGSSCHPRCWLGNSMECSNPQSGWIGGLYRLSPSDAAISSSSNWQRAVPMGLSTTFRTLEVGADARARWLWPPPQHLSKEPHMFCRWSIH